MVFGIIGENCSGKSTLAEKIMETLGGEIITGKDYLRMAKSESEAVSLFREKLRRAVSGDNIIYVIADPEQVKLLPVGDKLMRFDTIAVNTIVKNETVEVSPCDILFTDYL